MQIHFLYILLENGIVYYHNVDPRFKDQFQEDLLGNLLAAFQSTSQFIFKSQICKVFLDHYSILIRQFIIQDQSVSLVIGTDSENMRVLDRFSVQFATLFQSMLQFFQLELVDCEITSEFRHRIDIGYDDLRKSVELFS